MFNGSQIRLPIRTLKEREVLQLSGLEGLRSHTSLDDAERLPEGVIRDYCGNSFHPDLISSALGSDQCLQDWVGDAIEGSDSEVAGRNTVLQVYTHLCQEVEQLGIKQGVKFGAQLVKDFPPYPDHCDPQRQVAGPRIHDAPIVGPRPPRQTKQERFQLCFDAFRAPVTAVFQFDEYIRFLFGFQDGQLAQTTCGQPKLILLVLEDQYGQPSMWIIGASAYRVPLQGGQSVLCGRTQIRRTALGLSTRMWIPGSIRLYISVGLLGVLCACLHKSKRLRIALCIALHSLILITWPILFVFKMTIAPLSVSLGGSRLSVTPPNFGFFMSFVGMKVLEFSNTTILLPCRKKFLFTAHALFAPQFVLPIFMPVILTNCLPNGPFRTLAIS